MCRFAIYLGPPITIDLLTTRPAYSITRQSFNSRMSAEPLNGDGFGLAWYVPEISPVPAQFRSIQPAWNNVNLLHLARVSRSSAILAHVRAASPGFGVSESNCHPFAADQFAFMHNGTVADFHKLKRRIRGGLSDTSYHWTHGTTDSEHMFALFRDHVTRLAGGDPLEVMAGALLATITGLSRMTREIGSEQRSQLNVAVCDGQRAVISRYTTDEQSPGLSLYLRAGARYVCDGDVCQMIDENGQHDTVIVASEPLTDEPGWTEVPRNHLLLINADRRITSRAIPG